MSELIFRSQSDNKFLSFVNNEIAIFVSKLKVLIKFSLKIFSEFLPVFSGFSRRIKLLLMLRYSNVNSSLVLGNLQSLFTTAMLATITFLSHKFKVQLQALLVNTFNDDNTLILREFQSTRFQMSAIYQQTLISSFPT